MQRTREEFRALRESLGISHAYLADRLDVKERSVARWEKPRDDEFYTPPQDAWDILDREKVIQGAFVNHAIHEAAKAAMMLSDFEDSFTLSVDRFNYHDSVMVFPIDAGFNNLSENEERTTPLTIKLPYYLTESDFAETHPNIRDARCMSLVNADSRLLAGVLELSGFTVEFVSCWQ